MYGNVKCLTKSNKDETKKLIIFKMILERFLQYAEFLNIFEQLDHSRSFCRNLICIIKIMKMK